MTNSDARKRAQEAAKAAQTPATAPNSPDAGTESHPCHSGPQTANRVVAREPLDPDAIAAIRERHEAFPARGGSADIETLLAALDEARAARDSHFAARNMLAKKVDRLESQLAEVRRTSRVLPCDGLCSEWPEEDCSLHGREPAELWEAIAEKNKHAEAERNRADALAAKVERVERLADNWVTATCLDDGAPCTFHRQAPGYASDLRNALADPAGDPS